jgi:hypothetical protein
MRRIDTDCALAVQLAIGLAIVSLLPALGYSQRLPMEIIKNVQIAPGEVLVQSVSPSGRFRVRQTWRVDTDTRSAISIEEVSSGKTVASIQKGSLGPIVWAPKEDFLIIWIQGLMRSLTPYANSSYNEFDSVNLRTGQVEELTHKAEEHYKIYFKPLFEVLETGRHHPDPSYSAYSQAYFHGLDGDGAIIEVNALGYSCVYLVGMVDGAIREINRLPPNRTPVSIAAGNSEIIYRSDMIGEGDIAERHEIFGPSGRRKWIDLYYMEKFGQPQKLERRAYTREDSVKVVKIK